MAEQASGKPTRKLWVQAVVTIITYILLQAFGIELPADVGLALQVLFETLAPVLAGFIAGYWVKPSAEDKVVPEGK